LAESLASRAEERLVLEQQHSLKSGKVFFPKLKKLLIFSKSDCKMCEGRVISNKYLYSSWDRHYLVSIIHLLESLFDNVPYFIKSG